VVLTVLYFFRYLERKGVSAKLYYYSLSEKKVRKIREISFDVNGFDNESDID